MKRKKKRKNQGERQIASRDEVYKELEKLMEKHYTGIVNILDYYIRSLTNGGNLIDGYDAKDIIQIMSIKLLDSDLPERKRRKWYKNECPDFKYFFLKGCFSTINNFYKQSHREIYYAKPNTNNDSYDEQNEEIEMETNDNVNQSFTEGKYTYTLDLENDPAVCRQIFKDYNNIPDEEDLSDEETEQIIESVLNELIKRNDQVGLIVFKSSIEEDSNENSKDRNIASKHNIPIKEVRNAKKRVKRIFENIYMEFKNEKKNK